MRILVAEDERITRASLVRQLEGWGHTVTAQEDGERAWDAYQTGEFDLVITDWEMPCLSGLELIQRIRAQARASYVYIIMLTSRSDKSDIVSGIEVGADDFVSKPFDKEELRVRLLAGERVVRLERTLSAQNDELREASERMRRDLEAAAKVQRAMLPATSIESDRIRAVFTYVPTDELAGDALGFHLVDDRHLVSYVVDVTGHGVPAALLAVTVMHALKPSGDSASLLRRTLGAAEANAGPAKVVSELNRRFSAGSDDRRFLTMLLGALDTRTGRLRFARAGHPLPLVLRRGEFIEVSDEGGLPMGIVEDADYEEAFVQLEPGDRVFLYSDGFPEQCDPTGATQFGEKRLRELLASLGQEPGELLAAHAVEALAGWAGARFFADDVSLVVIDWRGG